MKIISKNDIKSYEGQQLEPTEWFEVSQERINQFADVTLDHQFIHVDPERAKQSPFGSTIAHGFLTLSLLSHFSEQYALLIDGTQMGVNYGFEKVRFLAPVKAGKRIRGLAKVLSVEEVKPNQFRFATEVSVEIEGEDKPALIAEWVTMQFVA